MTRWQATFEIQTDLGKRMGPLLDGQALCWIAILLVAALLLPGSQLIAAETQTPAETGQLTGQVTMTGKPVPDQQIQVTKDTGHCHPADIRLVRLGKQGALADVVIEFRRIKAPAEGWNWPKPPAYGYVLRQQGCSFSPYLLVMPDGAELKVINDDPVAHNVNTGSWNIMQPAKAEPIVRKLSGRQPIRVGCNIHSWMEAWVYTVKSPLYAVTGLDGEYVIKNIPPGKYRATAWHPYLGLKRFRVNIRANQEVVHDLQYESLE
jgi:hypothetical protein